MARGIRAARVGGEHGDRALKTPGDGGFSMAAYRGPISVFFLAWGCIALGLLGYSLLTGAQVAAPYGSSLCGIVGIAFLALAGVFLARPDWDWWADAADKGLRTRKDARFEEADERSKANEEAVDKELMRDYRIEAEGKDRG